MVNLYILVGANHHLFQLPHPKKPQGIPQTPGSYYLLTFQGWILTKASWYAINWAPDRHQNIPFEMIGIRHTVERKIRSILVKWPILKKKKYSRDPSSCSTFFFQTKGFSFCQVSRCRCRWWVASDRGRACRVVLSIRYPICDWCRQGEIFQAPTLLLILTTKA